MAAEGDEIQRLIERDDSHISSAYFKEIVTELRSRKILQGDATLYITPKLLHIWLWSQWWKIYSSGFHAGDFFKSLSPGLARVLSLTCLFTPRHRLQHRT